jgi:hypothetical protein
MELQQKNIALYVVLSIVTCGIFGLYWYYTIATDIYNTNNNISTTPIVTLLLNIVTGSIYGVYVYYKWGQALKETCDEKGIPGEDRAVLYLVLSIFGLGIINMALIQSDINQMATAE